MKKFPSEILRNFRIGNLLRACPRNPHSCFRVPHTRDCGNTPGPRPYLQDFLWRYALARGPLRLVQVQIASVQSQYQIF